jgi:hypothetical protein
LNVRSSDGIRGDVLSGLFTQGMGAPIQMMQWGPQMGSAPMQMMQWGPQMGSTPMQMMQWGPAQMGSAPMQMMQWDPQMGVMFNPMMGMRL